MIKFLKEAWNIHVEAAKTKKALRLLVKQSWSVDFLSALLIKAANIYGKPLEMTIISKDGVRIQVNTLEIKHTTFNDESIFNHLDDENRIQQFMAAIR